MSQASNVLSGTTLYVRSSNSSESYNIPTSQSTVTVTDDSATGVSQMAKAANELVGTNFAELGQYELLGILGERSKMNFDIPAPYVAVLLGSSVLVTYAVFVSSLVNAVAGITLLATTITAIFEINAKRRGKQSG